MRRVFGACLALLAHAGAAEAREPKVEVLGCVVDAKGAPIRNAFVAVEGVNYRGGYQYHDDDGTTSTDWDGNFSIPMKAGKPGEPATARIFAKDSIARADNSDRGGVSRPQAVENSGKPDGRRRPCLVVEGPFRIGGVLRGFTAGTFEKPNGYLKLRLDVAVVREGWPLQLGRDGRFEWSREYPNGAQYEVQVVAQPGENECEVTEGKSGSIAGEHVTGIVVVCKPAPGKPAREVDNVKPSPEYAAPAAAPAAALALPRRGDSSGGALAGAVIADAGKPPAGTSGPGGQGGAGAAGSSGNCLDEYNRKDAEFKELQQRKPRTQDNIRDSQMAMYILTEFIKLLDAHCRGHPKYAERAQLQSLHEQMRRSCQSTANNPSSCVARKSW